MRPAQLSLILEREFESTRDGHHTPVMMWGPPGVGKSQIVMQVAAKHNVAVIDIRLSQMEPSDLRGIPFRVGEHVEWAVPAMLPDAQRHGAAGHPVPGRNHVCAAERFGCRVPADSGPQTRAPMKCRWAGRFLPRAIARAIVA